MPHDDASKDKIRQGQLKYWDRKREVAAASGLPLEGNVPLGDVTCITCNDVFYGRKNRKMCDECRTRHQKNMLLTGLHGITLEQYEALLIAQDGRCGICRRLEGTGRYEVFAVDHCHATGLVRGLLCGGCNVGLGHFRDNIDALTNAIEYLKNAQNTAIVREFRTTRQKLEGTSNAD